MFGKFLRSGAAIPLALLAAPLSAFGTTYGNEACNNDTSYLEENGIVCTAVFSDTNVWDFLNNLQRRITFDELVALNPLLEIEGYDTVLIGITFVRVQ
ncbi:hypothetical protein BC777_2609 [Yoonia maricola]|uniref:LysM domain-containing protein n=1 Tax=Yoonia maricola TaxID=420999 RepID=A0A2M8W5M9_9RHOB|nr:hypothetical protein [Yoonia maricola]PJI86241.1 hypothetical protein BC777_2609 [Yoonia maricola]